MEVGENGKEQRSMNEKFFDLKKEKQDRMINAALKVFARKGYEHASTDDIVKEAGISKGLLFHYFISKLGLYSFVYDYSVKYMMLELSTGVDKEETDYFELRYEDQNMNKKYFYKWDEPGLRYELQEFVSCIVNNRMTSARLRPQESIAMARIMQQVAERKNVFEL